MGIERHLKRDVFFFIQLNKEFFESIECHQPVSDELLKEVKNFLPNEWNIKKEKLWYYASPPSIIHIPLQGWKIHISATILTAKEILKRVVPILIEKITSFKFVVDLDILKFINSKNSNRASSGKFITIYPETEERFKEILEKIYSKTKDLKGPYILSDRPYKDSRIVFYRYGGFYFQYHLNIYGEKIPVIKLQNGEIIPDQRVPYFYLPEGINDPFQEKEPEYEEKVLLKDRYLVGNPIIFSNKGGVYKGEDTKMKQKVVIKESRPFVDSNEKGIDAIDILEKEYKILKKLEDTGFTPRSIDFFKEWEHYFLVEEFVEGVHLTSYRAIEGIGLLLRKNLTPEILKKFCSNLYNIIINLAKMIKSIHERGIIIGDLSPANILINVDTLEQKIIDFEGAYDTDDSKMPDLPIFTTGFVSPQRLQGNPLSFEDDYYSLGGIIYSMILPVNMMFTFSPKSKSMFLNTIFNDIGLPASIKDLIRNLMSEDPSNRPKPDEVMLLIKKMKMNLEGTSREL